MALPSLKSALGLGLAAAVAIIGFVAVQSLFGGGPTTSSELSEQTSATLSETPVVASDGLPTKLAALRGQWLVVFFGYMSCPDVCPTEMAYLAKEMRLLGPSAARVRGVFVSVDPGRDEPTRLGRFVRSFDSRFLALTGTPDNLQKLAKAFGAFFEIGKEEKPGEGYPVMHSSAFFLVSPKGVMVRAVSPPHEPGDLSKVLAPLIGATPGDGVRVDSAWTRPTPAGAKVTALYMKLQNDGDAPAIIESVQVEGASRAEIHETTMTKGIMQMHAVPELEIAAHNRKEMVPGGMHVMVFDLPKELVEGDQLHVKLTLKDGRQVLATATATTRQM